MKPSLVGRLMLAYAAVIAAVLVSAWWAQHSLDAVEQVAARLSQRSEEALDLSAKLETLVREKSHVAEYLLSGDERITDELRPHRTQFQQWIQELADFARTDEERALVETMRAGYAAYTEKVDDVLRLEQSGEGTVARARFFSMRDDIEQVLASSQRLLMLAQADMRERRRVAQDTLDRGRALLFWLTGLGAVLSLALGFVLSRYAARPIYQLVLRLGASGMVNTVEVKGDEIGALESHVNTLLERVREQERALQQAEKLSELGEIASEIAHETLNPITGVKAMLQALRRARLPQDRLLGELGEMERQLERVSATVRRLMHYARPLEPHVQRVRVAEIVARSVRTAALVPGAAHHAIRTAVVPEDLEWELDPDLIEQAVVNLVVNGCEASPPDSPVVVEARVHDDHLVVAVRDHGPGVAAAIRDRLFHPFFTTKPGGNGLGLAVSRNIVREHGGLIEAVPAEPRGSVFRLMLPRGDRVLCGSPS